MENLFSQPIDKKLYPVKLQKLLVNGKKSDALRFLDKIIENDGGLFQHEASFLENRRLSWLIRIDLLRDWGRLSEALAWTCLECELNPDNVAAHALKERLKRELRLVPLKQQTPRVSVQSNHCLKWEGVAGMRELKAVFERDIILPLKEPELYKKYRVSLPNGVLLYGPPGCGKTFIARKLAEQLDYNFQEIKPSDLASIYVHGTQKKIGELFAQAKAKAPCMLFLDEIEALVPNRGGNHIGHHYQAEVNEFLVHLNECAKNNILVIGATNLPKNIDPAVRRPGRLDKKIFVGPPDMEARMQMLKMCMKDRPQSQLNYPHLAEQAEFYTYAELELVVDEAARDALSVRKPITTELIARALKNNTPAYTRAQIEEMMNLS